jgi:histidine triad (HIT) family protein
MCGDSSTRVPHCGSIAYATTFRESHARLSFGNHDRLPLLQDHRGRDQGAIVYQDNDLIAIRDINPQAPLHVLIMPRQHIATINDLTPANDALVGSMFRAAAALAKEHWYAERGYRTVFNCNSEAGQSVFHIHLHLLAGRPMLWPPG